MNELEWVTDIVISIYEQDGEPTMLVHRIHKESETNRDTPASWYKSPSKATAQVETLLSTALEEYNNDNA